MNCVSQALQGRHVFTLAPLFRRDKDAPSTDSEVKQLSNWLCFMHRRQTAVLTATKLFEKIASMTQVVMFCWSYFNFARPIVHLRGDYSYFQILNIFLSIYIFKEIYNYIIIALPFIHNVALFKVVLNHPVYICFNNSKDILRALISNYA